MPRAAEEIQEQGRKGVIKDVRRWLEATMRFELPYNVYQYTVRCTLDLVGGTEKRFDLRGDHYDEHRSSIREIYIEVKTVTTSTRLAEWWTEFLCVAYSAFHYAWDQRQRDPELEFMFVATHAWHSSKYWDLTSESEVRRQLKTEAHKDLLPESGIDDERLRVFVDRLFVWIVPKRQNDMTMSKRYRGWVKDRIEVEGDAA